MDTRVLVAGGAGFIGSRLATERIHHVERGPLEPRHGGARVIETVGTQEPLSLAGRPTISRGRPLEALVTA